MGFVVDKVPLGQVFFSRNFVFPLLTSFFILLLPERHTAKSGYFPKSSDLSEIGEYRIEIHF